MKHLFKLNHFFVKYKWRFGLGIIFVSLANYFGILIPQQIRKALDLVQDKISIFKQSGATIDSSTYDSLSHQLFIFGLIITGFVILKGIFMFYMRQTIIVMSRLIEYDMRKDIFAHLQTLDQSFYKARMTGDIMARISEDVSKVRNYIGPGVLYAINLITTFIFTIYAMWNVDKTLTIWALLPLPILSISIYYISNIINKRSTDIQNQLSTLTSEAQETFSGIKVLKSYAKEDAFLEFYDKECEEFKTRSLALAKVEAYFQPLMVLLIALSTIIVVVVGGWQVQAGKMTPGNIAEFILYINMLTWPVTAIGWIASTVQEAEASQARINEIMDIQPQIKSGNRILGECKGKIEFRNVSFTYENTGVKALQNVSFILEPGQKMAILGKTASGKTTIAELLNRIYEVNEGEILVDDVNIKEYDVKSLRDALGYVPQDVFLFSDTITQNIGFGVDIDNDQAIEYARRASIYEEIGELSDGFDTVIGERGVTLSGGQKQRVSIARAYTKSPQIFLFDDVLSAVDTNTERRILSQFADNLADKTAIFITHRPSQLLEFDIILVIDDSRIIQSGTHGKLMSEEGFYKNTAMQHILHDN